jgi:hypothetical protein
MRRNLTLFALLVGAAWIIGQLAHAPGASHSTASGFKALLIPLANLYLNLFNSPSTALGLCVAMVVLAIVLFLYTYLGRISPMLRDLDGVADALRRIASRREDAARQLASVDTVMAGHPIVARSWKLFRATLSQDDRGRVTAPRPPAHYLNMAALEHGGVRLRFFLGLPNDFVGLGLIFTFLGLVAGLYFASRSMLSADLADARAALTMLLHAATFKFLTSITGIGISMLMGGAQRIILDQIQARLAELQILIEEMIPLRGTGEPLPAEIVPPLPAAAPEPAAGSQKAVAVS